MAYLWRIFIFWSRILAILTTRYARGIPGAGRLVTVRELGSTQCKGRVSRSAAY